MFMDLYQKARADAFTASNIDGAWRGAGLIPLDPGQAVSYACPRLATPPSPEAPTADVLPPLPQTPRSSGGVQKHRMQLLSPSKRLYPHARVSIQKISNAAQQAMTEDALLQYENRQLRYRLYEKEAWNAIKKSIASMARVVSEKDIQEAKLTENAVRQAQSECPGWPPATENQEQNWNW